MKRCLAASCLLILASCSKQAATGEADKAIAANSADAIAALPPKLREIALYRAIREAGQSCNRITNIWQLPTKNGNTGWQVRCDSSGDHRVQVSPDGTASVTSLLVP